MGRGASPCPWDIIYFHLFAVALFPTAFTQSGKTRLPIEHSKVGQSRENSRKKIFYCPLLHYSYWLCQSLLTLWLTSLVAQMIKHLSTMPETRVQSLGREDPLEKEIAAHSSTIAWKSHGQRSLVGYSPWSHKESDTTEHVLTLGMWEKPFILHFCLSSPFVLIF